MMEDDIRRIDIFKYLLDNKHLPLQRSSINSFSSHYNEGLFDYYSTCLYGNFAKSSSHIQVPKHTRYVLLYVL